MIKTNYYKLKGDTLIRRDESEIRANYRLMNKDTSGQWTDGNSKRYLIPGRAHEISEAEARLMAARFGSTIDDPEVRTGIPMLDEIVRKILTGTGRMAEAIEAMDKAPRVYPPDKGIRYDPAWQDDIFDP
jgi:hypothetical protein